MLLCVDSIKSFWPSTFVEWVQIVSYIVSGIGILIAAVSYSNNKKIKRAEWLKSLFDKFYESENYKEVRRWLDFEKIDKSLSKNLEKDVEHENEEKFADYLNFFEFIGVLEINGQIKLDEITMIFTYYLRLIKNSEFCMKYIKDYGYNNL